MSLDLKHIRTVPSDYHIDWLQVNGDILRADVMRKAWWGMKYRKCGDLLTPVRDADAKIKELEGKLEAAKRDRSAKLEDVKLIAITYDKSGKLFGDIINDKKDSKATSTADAISKAKTADDKPKDGKPKPIMAGKLKAVANSGNNQQQNGKKNNNQNH